MPQLDIFMFQNVIVYSIIIFFILSYNIYQILIHIFKILKTRILLKKMLVHSSAPEINSFFTGKNTNNFNILVKELDTPKTKI